jgi:hypothetical protein
VRKTKEQQCAGAICVICVIVCVSFCCSKNFDKQGRLLSKNELAQIDLTRARKVVSALQSARKKHVNKHHHDDDDHDSKLESNRTKHTDIKVTRTGGWGKIQGALARGGQAFKERAQTAEAKSGSGSSGSDVSKYESDSD